MLNIPQILSKIKNISTDSRTVAPGDLFIAIAGEKFDAHDFARDVINNKGAALAIVQRPIADVPEDKQIIVPDTKIAYLQIGEYIRRQLVRRSLGEGGSKAKVIALTGSAGKTTTKEMLKFALSKFARVYATEGNFNNDIGVAKTLCAMPAETEIAIVEIGMNHAGEIANIVPHVAPDIAIVTNVYPMHIEFFPEGLPGIARAKAEIFAGLGQNGAAVINADSNCVEILTAAARNVVLYGKKDLISVSETGNQTQATLNISGQQVDITLPLIGEHNISNALCVLTVVSQLGLDVRRAAAALADFGALPGRGKVHRLRLPNGGEYTLIDESYSAQPESLKIAIRNLDSMNAGLPPGASAKGGRKIAVVGKMAEIGDKSAEMHCEIGRILAQTDIDVVVGICPETRDILAQLPDSKFEKHYFEDNTGLEDFLIGNLLRDGDAVLIKGSHYGSRLFETVEKLIK